METPAATPPTSKRRSPILRALQFVAWALLVPLLIVIVGGAIVYQQVDNYLAAHANRVYTGVSVHGVDLSQLTHNEAVDRVAAQAATLDLPGIRLVDSQLGSEMTLAWSELGVTLDVDAMVVGALDFGRNQPKNETNIFNAWYYGQSMPAIWVVDEFKLDLALNSLAEQLAAPAQDASFQLQDTTVSYTPAAIGRQLDKAPLRAHVIAHVGQPTVEPFSLSFDSVEPVVETVEAEASQLASQLAQLLEGERTLYVEQPLDSDDLSNLTISEQQVEQWLQIDVEGTPTVDTLAIESWVQSHAATYTRYPTDARFYFDDLTEELVVVEPHVSGRQLNVAESTRRVAEALRNNVASVPLAFTEIVPAVHSGVTGAELGITELLAEETTWFFDSPNDRKHNIRVGSSKFYGIVIKPGEEFSFNKYLGPISYDNDFVDGLVIIGGRTQGGIGGGICQVSTTMFQTAFWAGLDIVERNQHGYRVSYYESAPRGVDKPHGMDAAIYSFPNNPDIDVDFKFVNNTPHHILVESYYYESDESLTIKFYSTDIGRVVERNITTAEEENAPEDRYVYNPSLPAGEIEQVEWAAEGGIASVYRIVYNRFGDVRDEEFFVSRYTPWANVYEYGDGATFSSP